MICFMATIITSSFVATIYYNLPDLNLLEEQNVWMIPGSTYGEAGEGYVRISNAQPAERLAEAMERIKKFIS